MTPPNPQKIQKTVGGLAAWLLAASFTAHSNSMQASPGDHGQSVDPVDLWAIENLHAWEVPTIDLVKRTSDERAKMLKEVGFNYYAYLPMGDPSGKQPDINTSQLDIDAEIEAMKRHGIGIRAWYFWVNGDDPAKDPTVMRTLEAFKRHAIHPQIWAAQSFADPHAESKEGFPTSADEQAIRVKREAARIAAFVRLAAPYGCSVNLYNHKGWFGMMDNQLAILSRLKELGITNVGMVYNFGHSKSETHDDSSNFTEIWERIKAHVVTVNIWVFGQRELQMMRVIQQSGWQGAVGWEPIGGDAELNLKNALWTAQWAAQQLNSDDRASAN